MTLAVQKKSHKVLMMIKASKLGWAGLGAGQRHSKSRAEAGAGKEQGRSRAKAGQEKGSSKAHTVPQSPKS